MGCPSLTPFHISLLILIYCCTYLGSSGSPSVIGGVNDVALPNHKHAAVVNAGGVLDFKVRRRTSALPSGRQRYAREEGGALSVVFDMSITSRQSIMWNTTLDIISVVPSDIVLNISGAITLPFLPIGVPQIVVFEADTPSKFQNRPFTLTVSHLWNTYDVIAPPASGLLELHVLSVNDFHGRIGIAPPNSSTALAVLLAAQVERQRALYGPENCLFVSVGDLVGASQYESAVQLDKPTLKVFETLQVVASTIGNHELVNGFTYYMMNIASSNISFLSANIYDNSTRLPMGEEVLSFSYQLSSDQSYLLTLMGLTTLEATSSIMPTNIDNIDVRDPIDAMTNLFATTGDALGDVVILAHIGARQLNENHTLSHQLDLDTEFRDLIVESPPAVIAILTAHTHETYSWAQNFTRDGYTFDRPILQSGHYGEWLGDIKILVDVNTGKAIKVEGTNILMTEGLDSTTLNAYLESNEVVKTVANIMTLAELESYTEAHLRVGDIRAPLLHSDRYGETPLCDVAADGILEAAVTEGFWVDLSIQNTGAIREDIAPADNHVLMRNIYNSLPFGNRLVIVDLPGEALREVLDQQWLPNGFTRRLCLSGMTYWYDSRLDYNSRVDEKSITLKTKPYDPTTIFKVVTNEFIALGGDGFTGMTKQTGIRYLSWIENETMSYYVGKHSPVDIPTEPRTVDKASYIGDDVTFTFTAPRQILRAGEKYTTEVAFTTEADCGSKIDFLYEDITFYTLPSGTVETNHTYTVSLNVTQTSSGEPDAVIMAYSRQFTNNVLGFGLRARSLYPKSQTSHGARTLVDSLVVSSVFMTLLLFC